MALFLGARLSLKTAGMICLIGFVLASLPNIIIKKWPAAKVRNIWHGLALVFFSICFMARIPYYKIFNAAFNMMLINGAHDDIKAIFVTAIEYYQLLWRLPTAIVIGLILAWLFVQMQKHIPIIPFAECKRKSLVAVSTVVLTAVFCVFVRYGGAFNYANSINWESAARSKSNLLNEAILDDGQALYRVRSNKKMLAKVNNINISEQELRQKVALAGGDSSAATISAAFSRTVLQPMLESKPSNVVMIVGESFGQWPFLPKFMDLGLVNNMIALQNSSNAAHINVMLANGSGTISSINGLLTGLPNNGIYENYQALSMSQKYQSGIGYIMKSLGYRTVFWYGGFPGWQNLKRFVMAQSFDEFHCADEFGNTGGNAWGCPDGMLFDNIVEYMDGEQAGQKFFHLVLTTSNHPPYTINVDKMGFPREKVRNKLPADISKDDKTLTELGHIWYADKTMGDFVKKVEEIYPDSLFVITGDHSERFDFAIEQDTMTKSTIPCIFYGQGVQQSWFGDDSIGCHMQLPATLAEMLGDKEFKYSSLMPSFYNQDSYIFNYRIYVKDGKIGEVSKLEDKQLKEYTDSMRGIGAWRVLKGNLIKEK